jgi:cellobiose-specific phosphotransferase system component IIA
MRDRIFTALKLVYQGQIAEAEANIHIYLRNPVGIGEHSEIVAEVDKQIEKAAQAQEKLLLKKNKG